MPYRIDVDQPPGDALDRLVDLGALDVDQAGNRLAAILPDGVPPDVAARVLGVDRVAVSAATSRDAGSVWRLGPRAVTVGGLSIAPEGAEAPAGALRLLDADAFGTGLHPTTALTLAALADAVAMAPGGPMLDVGTGSGILALAALRLGASEATGLDVDPAALDVAAGNARLNGVSDRLRLVHGGPDAVDGAWPLVAANVLAAPLIEMAPVLVRRVARRGRLVLSGIPHALDGDVRRAYQHLGMHHRHTDRRAGWVAVVLDASW
ncbi:MAG: 50S ribosomal protein L11 methyltransferase [Vicinamibacterales bacterium]